MYTKSKNILIVVVGPTAVGKTSLTVELAQAFQSCVINADSRQVFKEMSIGTAKPTFSEMKGIKHYFVGDRDLKSDFSAGIFEDEALDILKGIYINSNVAILSGGSGLYIKAVCDGLDNMPDVDTTIRMELKEDLKNSGLDALSLELQKKDPEYWNEVDKGNPQRIIRALEVIRSTGKSFSSYRIKMPEERFFSTIKIGLDRPRVELYERINKRIDSMIDQGLFEEVRKLQLYRDRNALQTVGYQEVFGYMDGEYDEREAIRLLKRNSRRFAKRQLTWFKRDPDIRWFHPDELEEIIKFIRVKQES